MFLQYTSTISHQSSSLPALIIIIFITPQLLTVPAHCFRGERIDVDRGCLDEVSSSWGETKGPLMPTYLSAGGRLGSLR